MGIDHKVVAAVVEVLGCIEARVSEEQTQHQAHSKAWETSWMIGFAARTGQPTAAAVLDELVAGLVEAAAEPAVAVAVAEVAAGAAVDEDGLAAVVAVAADGPVEVAGIEPKHWRAMAEERREC